MGSQFDGSVLCNWHSAKALAKPAHWPGSLEPDCARTTGVGANIEATRRSPSTAATTYVDRFIVSSFRVSADGSAGSGACQPPSPIRQDRLGISIDLQNVRPIIVVVKSDIPKLSSKERLILDLLAGGEMFGLQLVEE